MSKGLRKFSGVLWIFLAGFSTLTVQARVFLPLSRVTLTETSHSQPWKGRTQSRLDHSTSSSLQASPTAMVGKSAALLLRGGEVSEIATAAYDWCINLGSPSALVAGAVIATIYENIGSGALDIGDDDSKNVKFGKRVTRVLLLSAFALEVLSIFVTTVTGTMLLSKTEDVLDDMVAVTKSTTPLSFLHDNFEFEYLTARITFLQGLLNWIMAIALGHFIPGDESKESRVMNKFIGSSLVLTIILMLAFYNHHMNFYPNYFCMVWRWLKVIFFRFVWLWPPHPSVLLSVPCFFKTAQLGYQAFFCADKLGKKEDKKGKDDMKITAQ